MARFLCSPEARVRIPRSRKIQEDAACKSPEAGLLWDNLRAVDHSNAAMHATLLHSRFQGRHQAGCQAPESRRRWRGQNSYSFPLPSRHGAWRDGRGAKRSPISRTNAIRPDRHIDKLQRPFDLAGRDINIPAFLPKADENKHPLKLRFVVTNGHCEQINRLISQGEKCLYSDMGNRGLNLWSMTEMVLPIRAGWRRG